MTGRHWPKAESDLLEAYVAEGKQPGEIASLLGRPKSEVQSMIYRLREAAEAEADLQAVKAKRSKQDDWGKGFWDENVRERGTTPRMRQAPVNITVGGVQPY